MGISAATLGPYAITVYLEYLCRNILLLILIITKFIVVKWAVSRYQAGCWLPTADLIDC